MSRPSITEMLAALAPGEKRVYPPRSPAPAAPERFFEVHQRSADLPELIWPHSARAEKEPCSGDRLRPHVGIDVVPEYRAQLRGASDKIGDFYSTDTDVYFMSNRLIELIERIDPDAIVQRSARVFAKDGEVQFRAVMPARVIAAVDTARTEVTVGSRLFSDGTALVSVSYESDVVFRADIPAAVHAFKDLDLYFWHWSRELIESAKAIGIRGIYANRMTGASPTCVTM